MEDLKSANDLFDFANYGVQVSFATALIFSGFGCAGNAFGYSSLHRKRCLEVDLRNPNIYTAVNDIKDNRDLENVYEEIQKRVANKGLKNSGRFFSDHYWMSKCRGFPLVIAGSNYVS